MCTAIERVKATSCTGNSSCTKLYHSYLYTECQRQTHTRTSTHAQLQTTHTRAHARARELTHKLFPEARKIGLYEIFVNAAPINLPQKLGPKTLANFTEIKLTSFLRPDTKYSEPENQVKPNFAGFIFCRATS